MRLAAIATSAVLALGLAACGGDESEVSDIVPRSVPELTVGEDAGLPAAPETNTTDTTDTTSTTDTTATTTGSTAAPAPAQTTTQPAPATGGTASPGTTTQQPDSGAGSGGFSDFCQQNPGACPGN